MTNFYDFVVSPILDDTKIRQDAKDFSEKVFRKLEREGIKIPVEFDQKNISDAIKFINKIGGEFKRTGTKVTASFTDELGKQVTVMGDFADSLNKYEEYINNATGIRIRDKERIQQDIEDFRTSGEKITPKQQIKDEEKKEIEAKNELIKKLKELYDVRVKLEDATAKRETFMQEYYSQLYLDNIKKYQEGLSELKEKGYSVDEITKLEGSFDEKLQVFTAKRQELLDAENLTKAKDALSQLSKDYSAFLTASTKIKKDSPNEEFIALTKNVQNTTKALSEMGIIFKDGVLSFDKTKSNIISPENIEKIQEIIRSINKEFAVKTGKQKDVFTDLKEKAEKTAESGEIQKIIKLITKLKSIYTEMMRMDKQSHPKEFEAVSSEFKKIVADLKKFGVQEGTDGDFSFLPSEESLVKTKDGVEQITNALQDLNSLFYKLGQRETDKEEAEKIARVKDTIKEYVNEYKKKKAIETIDGEDNLAEDYADVQKRLEKLTDELKQYGIIVERVAGGNVKLKASTDGVASSNDDFKKALEEANLTLNEQDRAQRNVVADFIKYRIVMRSVEEVIENFTSAIKEMNDAMTQVRMVNMASKEDTKELAREYSNLARQLGQTTTKVAEGADSWLRQGYNASDSLTLLKASTTLATVGQLEAAEATENLTSVINAYGIEVEDVIGVVDQLTNLDLHYAASSGGIATALQKVSSSAKQAGVSLEKLMSIITITTQITQQAPEVIGTSWQSIFTRMTKISAGVDLDDLTDEITGETHAVNEAEQVLKRYGISLVDETGKMRDLGVVLDEIGVKWKTMNKLEQNQLSFVVAGTRQRNAFIAAMDNYNMVMEAEKVALDSSGTATEKMTVYTESLEAAQNRLQATIQEFASNTNLDEWLIAGINLLEKFISLLDLLINKIPVLSPLIKTGLIAEGFVLLINTIGGTVQAADNLIVKFTKLKGAVEFLNPKTAWAGLVSLKNGLTGATVAAGTATTAFAGLNAVLWPLVGVSLVVGTLAWASYSESVEYAEKKLKDANDDFEKSKKELDSVKDTLLKNKQIIESIQNQGTISVTDEIQLDILQKENEELEKQLRIKKDINDSDLRKKLTATKKVLSRTPGATTSEQPNVPWESLSLSEREQFAKDKGLYNAYTGRITNEKQAESLYSGIMSSENLEKRNEVLLDSIKTYNDALIQGVATETEKKEYSNLLDEYVENLVTQDKIQEAIKFIFNQENFASIITEQKPQLEELGKQLVDGVISEEIYDEKIKEIAQKISSDSRIKNTLLSILDWEDTPENKNKLAELVSIQIDEANKEIEDNPLNLEKQWDTLTKKMDTVQSSFKTLTSAIEEYNTYGGFSTDTLQELTSLSDDYINALYVENGVMKINGEEILKTTLQRYDEAKALVYEQGLKEILAAQDEQEVENAATTSSALVGKAKVLATLTGEYGSLSEAIAQNAIIQQLAEDAGVSGFNKKQQAIAEATQKKIKLLDQAANGASKSFGNLKNQLNGYANSAKQANEANKQLLEDMKDAKSALSDLIDMTINMLKQQYDDEKESLDKQLEAFEKKIEAQKKYLELQTQELQHQKEIEEKNNNIANIQEQLAELEYDTSAEGQAKKIELLNQLNKTQQDLVDYQTQTETEKKQDALDKELESYKESIDKQKDYIDKVLMDEQNLYKKAIALIESRSIDFYNKLITWNKAYGTHIDEDVINAWNLAYEAMDKYSTLGQGLQGIMEGITKKVHELEKATKAAADQAARYSGAMGGYGGGSSNTTQTQSNPETELQNWKKKENVQSTTGYKTRYEALSDLRKYGYDSSSNIKQGPDNLWYIVGNRRPIVPGGGLNKPQIYHTGTDYVTKSNSWLDNFLGLKSNETAAILKVGEAVVPDYANVANTGLKQNLTNGFIKNRINTKQNDSQLSVDLGDVVVNGIDEKIIKEELERAKQTFADNVFKIINKHTNLNGTRNQRVFAL